VLTDLRVLAVDQTTNDQDNKPVLGKNVTFEVTPKQVEVIEVVAELGKLSLSLRSLAHQGDEGTEPRMAGSISVSHTLDTDVSPLIPKPGRRAAGGTAPPSITILRGDAVGGRPAPAAPSPSPSAGAPVGAPAAVAASTGVY